MPKAVLIWLFFTEVMASISCSFSSLIDDITSCGQSLYHYSSSITCTSLTECQKDVSQHLSATNVFGDKRTDSEMKLILARAG